MAIARLPSGTAPDREAHEGRASGRRQIVRQAIVDSFAKLEPAHALPQPGHLHRRDRRAAHHGPLRARRAQRRVVRARSLRAADRALALVHRPLRELRRGDRRGPRQGAGRHACAARARETTARRVRPTAAIEDVAAQRAAPRRHRPSSRRASSSPATATSSRASPTSTRPRSPASPRRSSRSRAPTSAAPSPAARPSSATGCASASPRTPARPSSTA